MGIDKQSTKGGNYVDGLFQMFDWNAKSRKKLFSSKSDIPEQSKQKKRCDGNFPMTRLQMLVDDDENADGLSVRGSSGYSRASSVTDEDFYGTRRANVVARLMGLESLPNSNMCEPYSTPLSDSQSLRGAYHQMKSYGHDQDQIVHSGSLPAAAVNQKYQKVINRPIEKFQTEALPPKSAKSIPITHHKLLSPIKSANSIHPKDAAHIMEVAAKIIEPGPQVAPKMRLPTVRSSSVPLKVRDLKEKAQAAKKQFKLFEGSQTKGESSTAKSLRGYPMNKSWNGSIDAPSAKGTTKDSETPSLGAKSREKSISLALQAKANVQKREGISIYSGRSQVNQREPCGVRPNEVTKSQSMNQKSMLKKQSTQNAPTVLRQNNQKQNCIPDRGKLPSKCSSKGMKTINGDPASAMQRGSSKLSGTSKVCTRKLSSDTKDDKREALSSSSSERVACKKRSIDGNYQSEKNKSVQNTRMDRNVKSIRSNAVINRQSSWDQDTNVISFTFTAPMTRSRTGSGSPAEAGESCKVFSSRSQGKISLLSSDEECAPKFSLVDCNSKGSDALSTLLEQKLKELAHKVELSQHRSNAALHETESFSNAIISPTMQDGGLVKVKINRDIQGVLEDVDSSSSQSRQNCRLPSPVSVLEHFSLADSCNSSDTSYITGGSKQRSSIQSQQVLDSYSLKTCQSVEGGDAELFDSASSSSSSVGTVEKRQATILMSSDTEMPGHWELEYVKSMLYNIELMFKDYTLGRSSEIISPNLFNRVGNRKGCYNKDGGVIPGISQRILFDCVSECLDIRCKLYAAGGCSLWAKGVSVLRRKDQLAEEVYREISGWSDIGDSMIDELVDKDMSSWHGRWLNYESESFELGKQVESRILNTLIDEVIADMLVL